MKVFNRSTFGQSPFQSFKSGLLHGITNDGPIIQQNEGVRCCKTQRRFSRRLFYIEKTKTISRTTRNMNHIYMVAQMRRGTYSTPVTPSKTRDSAVIVPVLSKQHTSTRPANGIRNGSVQNMAIE